MGSRVETPLHAVRDCLVARNVWVKFVQSDKLDIFFSLNLEEWLITNLLDFNEAIVQGVCWNILFGIITSRIYKERTKQLTFQWRIL